MIDLDALVARETRTMADLEALLSPGADARFGTPEGLDALARASADLTLRRFGRTISLYAPLYLSNFCINPCVYCGFSSRQDVARATLSEEEIRAEAASLRDRGFSHVLLVTGEDRRQAPVSYLERAIALCRELLRPRLGRGVPHGSRRLRPARGGRGGRGHPVPGDL
jgi:2-iminoacetate synthase